MLTKLYIIAVMAFNVPLVAQAWDANNAIDVRFIPNAVNNPKYILAVIVGIIKYIA